mmetsp:Transcript_2716/g.5850  ORF Transcript_2716/g.5850 Transcript_2716/m.5850 type:complete len:253 (-) Transcript_2716:438-1196(-)
MIYDLSSLQSVPKPLPTLPAPHHSAVSNSLHFSNIETNSPVEDDIESNWCSEPANPPITANQSSSVTNTEFYRPSLRCQNRFFGSGVVSIAASFVAAYFLMGISFTPSNIAIYGDEYHFVGGSGEVGADATNAQIQAVIDEEITKLEQEGNFGEAANTKIQGALTSEAHQKFKDMIIDKDKVGENEWVEDKNWWKENEKNIEAAEKKHPKQDAHEAKKREKMKKRCKRQKDLGEISDQCKEFLLTDVDSMFG